MKVQTRFFIEKVAPFLEFKFPHFAILLPNDEDVKMRLSPLHILGCRNLNYAKKCSISWYPIAGNEPLTPPSWAVLYLRV